MSDRELYEILGIKTDAAPTEIKSAYRALAKINHPDTGGDPETFIAITRAYTVLIDADTRAEYDASGIVFDDDVVAMQRFVFENIASLYETVLMEADERINETNIVEMMKERLQGNRHEYEFNEQSLKKMIKTLEYAKSRIKTKDGGKNIFLEITERQINGYREDYKKTIKNLRMMDAVAEELKRYDSIVDVVRTQMWVQGFSFASTSGSGWPIFRFDD